MRSDSGNRQRLKSQRFRDDRKQVWAKLELLLLKLDNSGMKGLSDAELLELPRLYRSTLSALSVARATSLDQSVIAYLESLSSRAYYGIYGSHTPIRSRIAGFFTHDWPAAARHFWRETLVSFGTTLLGTIVGFALTLSRPEWFYSFVNPQLAGDRGPSASTESLRATLYTKPEEAQGLEVFASFLFAHNSGVALLCFALGFAFGIPTLLLLLMTGLMLGAFIALFAGRGLGMEMGGWLSIHGTTEIFAIILAGAGGLAIGRAVAFPGRLSRLDSAKETGERAGILLGGVIIMLAAAGLLEGFGRQLINSDILRYLIGWGLLTLWCLYFYKRRSESAS